MDNIADKLTELLNSPSGMEKIKSAADVLLNSDEADAKEPEASSEDDIFSDGILDNIENIQKFMRIAELLKNSENDKRTKLLLSLKPHLSENRARRVDKAVLMLKIASLIPVLKEEGILSAIGF